MILSNVINVSKWWIKVYFLSQADGKQQKLFRSSMDIIIIYPIVVIGM